MRIPSPRAHRRARIEIIPLIDIIFFLLATFVMVSLSMVRNQGISLNLPVASTATAQDQDRRWVVSVAADGVLYLDKQRATLPELRKRFTGLAKTSPDTKVYLQGDEKADFGVVLSVLDTARETGLTKVVIQTKKP